MATIAFRRPRALLLALVMVLVAAAFIAVSAPPAQAQEQTGATATKDCPTAPVADPYTIGDTVECTATFTNAGLLPATVTSLTETEPFIAVGNPGNGTPIRHRLHAAGWNDGHRRGGHAGSGRGVHGGVRDRPSPTTPPCATRRSGTGWTSSWSTPSDPPLTAGAFATHTLAVFCPPTITVTKVADELCKVGDPVNYTIEVCNTGLIVVDQGVGDRLADR